MFEFRAKMLNWNILFAKKMNFQKMNFFDILKSVDRLTSEDLDGIIEEIDEDGSGTMDFDEFCAMMMS